MLVLMIVGNSVRWHFTHDQGDFYRANQGAVTLHDINFEKREGGYEIDCLID